MKIDSHKNVKVNISKTKSKFNGVKHKKKSHLQKCTILALHFSEAISITEKQWKPPAKTSGNIIWVGCTHHQLTVNAIWPNMKISENITSDKTFLGKLLEDV